MRILKTIIRSFRAKTLRLDRVRPIRVRATQNQAGLVRAAIFGAMMLALLGVNASTEASRGPLTMGTPTPESPDSGVNLSSTPDGSFPEEIDPAGKKKPPLITVNLAKVTGHIDPRALGLTVYAFGHNTTDSSYFYRSPEGNAMLKELGINALHYGTDFNDWAHLYDPSTAVPITYPEAMDAPEYLQLNQDLGAEPSIEVNVSILCHQTDPNQPPSTKNVTCQTATPQLAADWLRYINFQSTGTPKVKYVTLGGEPFAGCTPWTDPLGINCITPAGFHKIRLTAADYANRVKTWATALKAVDPTVKIGVNLQPNTFLCLKNCNRVSWDETVLKKSAKFIDFVVAHQYFVVKQYAPDEATAQQYSYYQRQSDIRVLYQGKTAMPRQLRQELSQWAPSKKNVPIIYSEFNASRIENASFDATFGTRQSLYTGFAVGELFLDLLQPVSVGGRQLPGATRAMLHDLYTSTVMIARNQPVLTLPQTMVFMPSWYVLQALADFRDKDLLQPTVSRNPTTPVRLPALRVYAVKSGKEVWLAVFNHNTTQAITVDVTLRGLAPQQATAVEIGNNAASFRTQNDLNNPNAITPTSLTVDPSQLTSNGIQGFVFPAHTATVIHITGK
jgi:alpha-L-arabinofuranosidase